MTRRLQRTLPIGAELQAGGGAHFRVWAASAQAISVEVDGSEHALAAESNGYFSGFVAAAKRRSRYGFRLDGEDKILPDPASRFQPDGPHERSQIIDPGAFAWTDAEWCGVELPGQILYELHIGTFTPQGTWRAAADKIVLLAEAGVSAIEMMPVADFPGRFGWGYDGVSLFAPTRLYGEPDDLRYFVDRAHQIGLGVILDVVYNHFGPDGNYLSRFSNTYLTDRYHNDWGDAINFDGPGSAPVREFVLTNATYWINEFHFDGLRLDATQQIFDASPEHILACLAREVRRAVFPRRTVLVAESETLEARLVRAADRGGYGLDGIWNDDFHHAARVAVTGHNEAYYSDYLGSARELLACVKHGFLYQGQRSRWQNKRRGTPSLDVEGPKLITYLENHDQVSNSGQGARLHDLTDTGRLRAATALLLLAPSTPMLFQGQEFASSKPFLYFADHHPELSQAVARGRREFLLQFPSLQNAPHADPSAPETFAACVLDWSERERNPWALRLHHDLIGLRRDDPVFRTQGARGIDGAVLGDEIFVLRFFGQDAGDRLLFVNLGLAFAPPVLAEPLVAPPAGKCWRLLWSSEDPAYGGSGIREPEIEGLWHISGHCAIVVTSE